MGSPDELPNLAAGIKIDSIADDGMVRGRVEQNEVLLIRQGAALFAVGAHCTHYGAPLADGLVVGETVRCPLHHACFSLRTGEAVRAPALDAIECWKVERDNRDSNVVYVRGKVAAQTERPKREVTTGSSKAAAPDSVVIVGGGAAGLAAADMLRRQGYSGQVTMISGDHAPPCDRPNLSKDYLAGTAGSIQIFVC